jgi:hypothetical protein
METASSALSILPKTAKEIKSFGLKLVDEINNGTINPLELARYKKSLEVLFEAIKEPLRDASLEEAAKYGSKEFDFLGAIYKTAEYGTKYDYEATGDPVWKDLNEKKKDRENFLKSLKEKHTYVDEETGDVITIYPPVKTSTTSVSVTIK